MTEHHTDEKKPAQGGLVAAEMSSGSSAFAHAPSGVFGHHINDGRNFVQARLDAVWREAIFGSELGKKRGEDDLMLQWLYLACVLRPQTPSLKGHLKRFILKVAFAVRSIFEPRYRNGGDGPSKNATEGKEAIGDGRVKSHGVPVWYIRPDADFVVRLDQDGSDFW